MYTQYGEIDGIKWLSFYQGGRDFMLYVGSLKIAYTCSHEPIFGVDTSDYGKMNEIMDDLQGRIVNEDLPKTSEELEARLTSLKEV